MTSISDDDLKSRLQRLNYPVPPITASTRGVLLKKLAQLEKAKAKSSKAKNSSLLDYSSAEDEVAINGHRGQGHQRKVRSRSKRNSSSSFLATSTPANSPLVEVGGRRNTRSQRSKAKALMNISDNDEEEEEESENESENQSESEKDEEQDEEEEESDEESEESDEQMELVDFGGQASLNDTSENMTLR